MSHSIQGRKVAIVAADGFEQSELLEPRKALEKAGAQVTIVAPEPGRIQGFEHFDRGEKVAVDITLAEAKAQDFDALVIPGGLFSPDKLRTDDKAIALTRAFVEAGKPVAAICHGPWLLIDAKVVNGRVVTSVPSIRTDLENAGADWRDSEVVLDQGLITSRTPDDLPAFNAKLIEAITASGGGG